MSDRLLPGESFGPGEGIRSASGDYEFRLDGDGRVRLYRTLTGESIRHVLTDTERVRRVANEGGRLVLRGDRERTARPSDGIVDGAAWWTFDNGDGTSSGSWVRLSDQFVLPSEWWPRVVERDQNLGGLGPRDGSYVPGAVFFLGSDGNGVLVDPRDGRWLNDTQTAGGVFHPSTAGGGFVLEAILVMAAPVAAAAAGALLGAGAAAGEAGAATGAEVAADAAAAGAWTAPTFGGTAVAGTEMVTATAAEVAAAAASGTAAVAAGGGGILATAGEVLATVGAAGEVVGAAAGAAAAVGLDVPGLTDTTPATPAPPAPASPVPDDVRGPALGLVGALALAAVGAFFLLD